MTRVMVGWLALIFMMVAAARAAEPERLDLGGDVTLELVRIPAGRFMMGSPEAEAGRNADEVAHEVRIASDYWLGATPVTRGQFARFVAETGYRTEAEVGGSGGFGFDGHGLVQRRDFTWRNPGFPQTDDHPVVLVTLKDARAFAAWLGRKARRQVTLPTEAQWEYACRAGATTRFYNGEGEEAAGEIAWFKDNAGGGTHPVGQKRPNAFGLYDMSGNVWEWCLDLYAPYRPGAPVQGPMDRPRNVIRGGSWLKDARSVRSAARFRNTPGSRNADNGFRVVAGPASAAPVERAAAPPVTNAAPPFTSQPPRQAYPSAPPIPMPGRAYYPQPGGVSLALPFFFFIGVFLVVLVLIVKAIGNAARANTRPKPWNAPPPLPHTAAPRHMILNRGVTRIDDDGFWFDDADANPGDRVRFTYQTPQGLMTREFVVEPGAGGQYIYTGARPENLALAELIASDMMMQQQSTMDMSPVPPVPPHPRETDFEEAVPSISHEEDRPFSGFPSAY